MRVPLSIFDFVSYAVPGLLYLGWLVWLAHLLGLTIPNVDNWSSPSLFQVTIGALVSYLLGHMAYQMVSWSLPWERSAVEVARESFKQRCPNLAHRPFVMVDTWLLLAALGDQNAASVASITSLRATGLMCRSCSNAMAIIALTLCIHLFLSPPCSPIGWPGAAILVLGSLVMRREGLRRSAWAHGITLEASAWIPGIDGALRNHRGGRPLLRKIARSKVGGKQR